MAVLDLWKKTTAGDSGSHAGKRHAVLATLSSLALVLAGCGDDPFAPSPAADSGEQNAAVAPARQVFDSPQAAFDAAKQAQANGDWGTVFDTYTPESRNQLVGSLGYAGGILAASGTRDDLKEALKKHGIDESELPKPPSMGDMANLQAMLQEMQKKQTEFAAKIADKRRFFVEIVQLVTENEDGNNPISSQMAAGQKAQADAKLSDLEITGDTAKGNREFVLNGKTVKMPLEFSRIDGSWYLQEPAKP